MKIKISLFIMCPMKQQDNVAFTYQSKIMAEMAWETCGNFVG
jgi:hypothetical protein